MTLEENETPVTARNRIRSIGSELVKAELSLKEARDKEVNALHEYEKAERAASLSPEAPRVTRGGTTVAERESWVGERCDAQRFAWQIAQANRQAAQDHRNTVDTQSMLAQGLLKSIDLAFRQGTRDDA